MPGRSVELSRVYQPSIPRRPCHWPPPRLPRLPMFPRLPKLPRDPRLPVFPVLPVPPRFPICARFATSPSLSIIGKYDCQSPPDPPGTNGILPPSSAFAAPAPSPSAAKLSAPEIAPAAAILFTLMVFMLSPPVQLGIFVHSP